MRSTLTAIILIAIAVSLLALAALNVAQLQAATVIQNTADPFQAVALERAKVRTGPGTVYDEVAWLENGASAPAIGRSEFKEWIQIEFSAAPGGKGWVFASLVSLEGGTLDSLPVAEAPPTPTLPPTATGSPDPITTPLPTRLPTFTPGPTAVIPTFDEAKPAAGFPSALLIIGLFGLGIGGGVMAYVRRNA